jgi:hypothetical protein
MGSIFAALIVIANMWLLVLIGRELGRQEARRGSVTVGELVMRHHAKTCPDCESNLAGKLPYIEHGHGDGSIPARPFMRRQSK